MRSSIYAWSKIHGSFSLLVYHRLIWTRRFAPRTQQNLSHHVLKIPSLRMYIFGTFPFVKEKVSIGLNKHRQLGILLTKAVETATFRSVFFSFFIGIHLKSRASKGEMEPWNGRLTGGIQLTFAFVSLMIKPIFSGGVRVGGRAISLSTAKSTIFPEYRYLQGICTPS